MLLTGRLDLIEKKFNKIKNKDIYGLSPIKFVEQNADKEFNLSYGICLDHKNFKAIISKNKKETEVNLQDLSDINNGYSEINHQSFIYNSDEFISKECSGPSANHVAAIFIPVFYPLGSIECDLMVENNFKPSDILIKYKSLDLDDAFLNEKIYSDDLHISERAEMEISGIVYSGKEYNFGHNLSFGGGSGSPLLFRYDKDDNFWFGDYYTEIFEETS